MLRTSYDGIALVDYMHMLCEIHDRYYDTILSNIYEQLVSFQLLCIMFTNIACAYVASRGLCGGYSMFLSSFLEGSKSEVKGHVHI